MFNSDFIEKFFGTNLLKTLDDNSFEKDLDQLKKDGEYVEENYEKDGKTIKIGSWTGNDGSFYQSKVVTYGKGLTKEPKNVKKLEEKLNEAIEKQEFEKCAKLRDEIKKLNPS